MDSGPAFLIYEDLQRMWLGEPGRRRPVPGLSGLVVDSVKRSRRSVGGDAGRDRSRWGDHLSGVSSAQSGPGGNLLAVQPRSLRGGESPHGVGSGHARRTGPGAAVAPLDFVDVGGDWTGPRGDCLDAAGESRTGSVAPLDRYDPVPCGRRMGRVGTLLEKVVATKAAREPRSEWKRHPAAWRPVESSPPCRPGPLTRRTA